jgi:4-hydroxy 2-oxovalerate aldolase
VPGYGTIDNIKAALDFGVDTFRVATHCSEADTAQKHIEFLRDMNVEVLAGLMMSHMVSPKELLIQAKKLEDYGAGAVTVLDSAGNMTPRTVEILMKLFKQNLHIPVGFHAHNNLGFSVINSCIAYEAGASIIDASIIGFGAGAGNVPLELFVSAMEAYGYRHSCDFPKILELADFSEVLFGYRPFVNSDSIISGLTGVVSVFSKPVKAAATDFGVDPKAIYFELGRRKAIAGQEDMILEIAQKLTSTKR